MKPCPIGTAATDARLGRRWRSMTAIRRDIEAVLGTIRAQRGLMGGLDGGDLTDTENLLTDALAQCRAEIAEIEREEAA